MKKKLHRTVAAALSVFLMAGVVLPVEANAVESPYDRTALAAHLEDAQSFGYGGLLDVRLLNEWYLTQGGQNISVADLYGVDQRWMSPDDDEQEAHQSPLDLTALNDLIYLNLDELLQIPLLGEDALLEFVLGDAQVGALREHAHAPLATTAEGGVGVVSDSGGIELTQPGEGANANIDLLTLLQIGGLDLGVILDGVITEAALEVGALSAVAKKPEPNPADGGSGECGELTRFDYNRLAVDSAANLFGNEEVLAEEHDRLCSDYQIAGAEVVIESPLLGGLVSGVSGTLSGLLGGLTGTLNDLLGEDSTLNNLSGILLGLSAIVEVDVKTDDISAALLEAPLVSDNGLVTIHLANEELEDETLAPAKISIDLEKLHGSNLNGQPANTSLLSGEQLGQITETVTNLLTASKSQEPHGLIARLDNVLRGDENKQGGLYATDVTIKTRVFGIPLVNLRATLGGLLGGSLTITTDEQTYENNPYTHYYADGLLQSLAPVVVDLFEFVGMLVENLLFDNERLGSLLNGVTNSLLSTSGLVPQLVNALTPVLSPIANIIMNRQTLQQVDNGTVFTVSALEVNVLDLNTSGELLHIPVATAAVMAQHWELIDLDFDVAKIGNGRSLYTGDYTYDLFCEAENWSGLDTDDLEYKAANVGDGFSFMGEPGQLALTGAMGGLSEPLRVIPGSLCTVTATSDQDGLRAWDALRPTGDNPDHTRTPYTYFLGMVNDDVVVSGETPGNDSDDPTTVMSPDNVQINNVTDEVTVTGGVSNEWKNHSFTFRIPEEAEDSHRVSIVHVYDIDTRDIVVSKTVDGEGFEGEDFEFEYSLDGGDNWTSAPGTPISHGGEFTIKDVPVLDLEDLNAEPSTQNSTEVMIREALGDKEAGPVVSWTLTEDENTLDLEDYGYAGNFATASFIAGPVAAMPTPDQKLKVTNSYAAITVDKHIDGDLGTLDKTTLIPRDAVTMTISYTVTDVGSVALGPTITLKDPSLLNAPFTIPASSGISVDEDGVIDGCTLAFNENKEATCSFDVTLTADPGEFFHYEADGAEVEATATMTTSDGRAVTARDTDKHGAMRLPGILGQLPATGVTTLVWVMALGLIAALTALALYVRSRRK